MAQAKSLTITENTATNNGGALYCNGAVLELTAQSGNIEFRDNSPNAIYFDNFSQKQLQLKAAQGKHILFDDPIAAQNINAFTTHLNPGNYTGTIHFSTSMELGNVTQYNGILKLSNGATLTAASYIHNAGGASTLALKAGATGSGLASPNSPLTFLSSSIIDVTGTGNKITGKSIAFTDGTRMKFNLAANQSADEPMLTLETTSQDALDKEVSINGVAVELTVPNPAPQKVNLLAAATGTTISGTPEFDNTLYNIELYCGDTKCTWAEKPTDPTPPDPTPGGDDDDSSQGGGSAETPDHGGSTGSDTDLDTPSDGGTEEEAPDQPSEPGTIVITPKPHPIEDMGGSANQAAAFAAFTTGNFAPDSFEYQLFYGPEGIHAALQQGSGRDGLTALSTLFPYDAPVIIDEARATTDFITAATWYGESQHAVAGQKGYATVWLSAGAANATADDFADGAYGYDVDRTHVALGVKTTLNADWTLGLGYSYGSSNIDSLQRSANSESHSLFGYAKYQSGPWHLKGLLAASRADYDEVAQVLNQQLTADYRATSLYGALMVGYELKTPRGAITPELGLSLLSVDVSDYDTSAGWDVEADRATLTSALAGLRWELAAYSSADWSLGFSGGLHARYDLSTTGIDYDITLSNGSHVGIAGVEPDRFALLPSLGAELVAGDFALKALVSGSVSDTVTAKALSLDFSYRF